MNPFQKFKNAFVFHSRKWRRMAWYQVRFRFNKWKKISGIEIPVYMHYGYSVLRFIADGTYECQELAIAKMKLSREDKVLELGTGIGFISAFCAKKIGSDRVYTFEANPLMEPLIKELYHKNNVSPHFEIGLLTSPDSQGIFSPKDDFLSSSEKSTTPESVQLKVPVIDLNETIKKIAPSYLIMDIEGNEFDIFSIIDFGTITKVQFELHPQFLKENQIEFIFEKLKSSGFQKDESTSSSNNYYFFK